MTTTSPSAPTDYFQLLKEQESSDLSIAEFARQRGIAAHRLYWERRKARALSGAAEHTAAEFREVVVADRATHPAEPLELRLPSGVSIAVSRDFDEVTLRRLLGLLTPC